MKSLMVFAAGLALLAGIAPAPAQAAACDQWGFAGSTALKQSNGWTTYFDSTGARALGATEAVSRSGHMRGTVEGAITGSDIRLVARWSNGPIGKYEGRVDASGYMQGVTYDANDPSSRATWRSDQQLRCIGS